ncbi:MAG: hypothetical protein K8R92_00080 [Planctomycetes bacterium]|nr:hypothetical protein [Planctomycetota bacterium]
MNVSIAMNKTAFVLAPLALSFMATAQTPPASGAGAPPSPAAAAGQADKSAPPADQGNRQGNRQDGRQGGQGGPGGRGMGGMGGMGGGPGGGLQRSLGAVTELREQFQPYIVKRDVPLIKEQLKLDDGQITVVENFVVDYETTFTAASDKASAAQQELMRSMFQSFMGGNMRERFQNFGEKAQKDIEQIEKESGAEMSPEQRGQYFRDQMDKMSQQIAAERETSGEAAETRKIVGNMNQLYEKWRRERAVMDRQVMDDIKTTLKPEQAARWESFERFMRREKLLSRGRLSGENVNLFAVVDEAGLSKEQITAVTPILDEYELRLDEALKRRSDYLAQNESKVLAAIQNSDAKSIEQIASKGIDLRNNVRDTNEQFRTAVAGALPPEEAQRFTKAALAAGFGRVYRPTRAERAFDKALTFEDLNPDTKAAIAEMQTAMMAEIVGMNEKIAQAIRKNEPTQLQEEAVRSAGLLNGGAGRMFGRNDPDVADEMLSKRGTMTDKYVERLKSLLTAEQVAQLPKGNGREDGRQRGPFGSWTIADMPEENRAMAKSVDKDGNGIIEGDERGELFRQMRPNDGGPGGPGGGPGGAQGGRQGGGQGGGGQGGRQRGGNTIN